VEHHGGCGDGVTLHGSSFVICSSTAVLVNMIQETHGWGGNNVENSSGDDRLWVFVPMHLSTTHTL